ncbi:ADP-ribosylation factor GTPase-activating protein AGD4-like [Hibiscus syriacus]|uniref:ADP-ribosylation factor GTPase-activating protein AGD4-like n=1 Tax=Hibiscus syriacus TaxID=106335 RepID=A0A6A2XKV0_HIBSY|nr:ADP-ribosylation factor GTPase-activating protein AGD4-like [Hibiscus syriacus]
MVSSEGMTAILQRRPNGADLIEWRTLAQSASNMDVGDGKSVVKLFRNGLTSVSAFKWLPHWSAETAVAFSTLHKLLMGPSSHCEADPSTTNELMESAFYSHLKGMLIDMKLEFQRLDPVIVACVDRLLGCDKHHWLGERLLQTMDENLHTRLVNDYGIVSYFILFNRFAENQIIPPRKSLELLTKFIAFLVGKHGPDTCGEKSWSHGTKVLDICRTMLTHHQSSRLFLGISRLLAFTCFYFPDLEVHDHARSYLRMLICVPGVKLRGMLKLGEQHLVLVFIFLPFGVGNKSKSFGGIRDSEASIDERELDSNIQFQITSGDERVDKPWVPLYVMDSKVSEILEILRHFSCIPDFRHTAGVKIKLPCNLRFDSEPFNHVWGDESPKIAPYESFRTYHIPFLLGQPPVSDYNHGETASLDANATYDGFGEEEIHKTPVVFEFEPREPTPGLIDVFIETNTEDGQIISSKLQSISLGLVQCFTEPDP